MEAEGRVSPVQDVRWLQRFQNFSRAVNLLRQAIAENEVSELTQLEQEGVIQRFEYTFELGWKTFKDYLEYSGVRLTEATARSVIKECATVGIFAAAEIDAEVYLEMMLARNALSHTYDFERFRKIIAKIETSYLSELEKEYDFFLAKALPDA